MVKGRDVVRGWLWYREVPTSLAGIAFSCDNVSWISRMPGTCKELDLANSMFVMSIWRLTVCV